MKPARLVGVICGVVCTLLLAFIYTQRTYLQFIFPQPAFASAGMAKISGSYATFSGTLRATQFIDNDNNAYYLDPNAAGNSLLVAGAVGIGTTSPINTLMTVGAPGTPQTAAATVGVFNAGSSYATFSDTTNNIEAMVGTSSVSNAAIVGSVTNNLLKFRTNNTDRVTIDTSGYVGIGTTSMDSKFEVYVSGSDDPGIRLEADPSEGNSPYFEILDLRSGGGYWSMLTGNGPSADNKFHIENGSTVLVTIDSTGRLGIGTISPSALLHVVGSQPADTGGATGTAATDTMTSSGGKGGTSTAATGTGGTGGDISNTTGVGGVASGNTSATGGRGGIFTFTGGAGGAPTGTGAEVGGVGGAMTVSLGTGGATSTNNIPNTGGNGGGFSLTAGTGGAAGNGSTGITTGGNGGNVTITAGTGGTASNNLVGGQAGNGGSVTIKGGRAGATNVAGSEGDIYFQLSSGAAAQSTRVTMADGAITLGGGYTSGTTNMDIAGIQTNSAVCHSGTTASTDNVGIVGCGAGLWADYMEMYAFDRSLQYGTIVTTGGNYTTTKAGDTITKLIPSTQPYQSNVIGIVSDASHINSFNAIGFNIQDSDNPQPLAINGRVLVNVTSANGAIKAGDPITASNIPGVGMKATKAGQIIGKALADYNNPDPNAVGKIIVFVNLSWYDPDVYLTSTGDLNISQNTTGTYQVTNNGTVVDKIGAFAHMVVANIKSGYIETQKLIVDGIDVEAKLSELSGRIDKQEQTIRELQTEIQQLKAQQ